MVAASEMQSLALKCTEHWIHAGCLKWGELVVSSGAARAGVPIALQGPLYGYMRDI